MKWIFVFTITFLSFTSISAQDDWEYLGILEVADIIKVVQDNNRYYALTMNGIYYREEEDSSWKIIQGTLKKAGLPGFPLVDFYVGNGVIYIIHMDDTVRRYLSVSYDFGESWNRLFFPMRILNDIQVAGDTIQFRSDNYIYFSTDGLKSDDFKHIDSRIPLNNDVDVYNSQYLMDDKGNLCEMENDAYEIRAGRIMATLPEKFKFLQLIHADSLVFVWATDEKDMVLFRFNPADGRLDPSLVFDHKRGISISTTIKSSTYFKYHKKAISLVTHEYGLESVYISHDLGTTWHVSEVFPRSYKEYFGDTLFINDGHRLYLSLDHGKTLLPWGKGILTPENLEIRAENSAIYVEKADIFEPQYFKYISDQKRFIEEDILNHTRWVMDTASTIYFVKANKLWLWNEKNGELTDNLSINTGNDVWNVHIANEVLFVFTNNGMKYSVDRGLSWEDFREDVGFTQIVFCKGFYFINQISSIAKSQDLNTWTPVDVHGAKYNDYRLLWVVADELFLIPQYSFMFGRYHETGDYIDISHNLPFFYNIHGSAIKSGLEVIDSSQIIAFHINQGMKYSDDGGDTWRELEDFKETKIIDVKVVGDDVYVLNMLGLWKRPLNFLTSAVVNQETDPSHKMTLYPNPASEHFFIKSSEPLSISCVHITDAYGRLISSHKDIQETICISSLPDGFYFVLLETSEGIRVRKLIKTD